MWRDAGVIVGQSAKARLHDGSRFRGAIIQGALTSVFARPARRQEFLHYDREALRRLSDTDLRSVLELYPGILQQEAARIPQQEIHVSSDNKPEDIAEKHFRELGHAVYRSRVSNGYRSIGAEFYWPSFRNKISAEDRAFIDRLRRILEPHALEGFADTVRQKPGTPDLLLIKDDRLSFVEVKANAETVKASTVRFFLRHGHSWPISILRIHLTRP